LSRQLVKNVAVEYRLLATNATAKPTVATTRFGEASSQRTAAGRFGAHNATAASNASTTTRSGRYRKVWASSRAVCFDDRIR